MSTPNVCAPTSATERKKKKRIPVVELFGPTIEGEGAVIGTQTMFIRFGLCDYKCTNCDSMHAVDPKFVKALAQVRTQEEIFEDMLKLMHKTNSMHIPTITFSGGNPAIHDLSHLVDLFHNIGKKIVVETQGTKHPEWLRKVDHLVVSPKGPGMGETFDPKAFTEFFSDLQPQVADYSIKVVVFSAQDLEFAAGVAGLVEHIVEGDSWKNHFYLSVGNPQPPKFSFDPEDPEQVLSDNFSSKALVVELLNRYNKISEEVMRDSRLSFARFLPQLHALVWGNETGR